MDINPISRCVEHAQTIFTTNTTFYKGAKDLFLKHCYQIQPQPAAQRRPVPPAGLNLEHLRDYSNDEIDAELRHLGLSCTGATTRYETNTMLASHDDRVRISHADQAQVMAAKATGQSSGISDELVHALVKHSRDPYDDVRAIAYGSVVVLKDELMQRGASSRSDTIEPELLQMLIHAFVFERIRLARRTKRR